MRILADASLLTAGGGVQVGLTFLNAAIRDTDLDVFAHVSNAVRAQLPQFPRSKLVYASVASDARSRLHCALSVPKSAALVHPDLVFTVFGPSYSPSRFPRLQGFALPRLIYPEVTIPVETGAQRARARVLSAMKALLVNRASSDHFVVETEVVRQRLITIFKLSAEQVHVIPNAASNIFTGAVVQARVTPNEQLRILVPSAYYSHKNLEVVPLVALALSRLLDQKFCFVLTIDENSGGIRDVARRMGVADHLLFVGPLPLTQLRAEYEAADAVFLPTLLECSTAVYPEAFSAERPLVTSNVDFARELCRSAACYVDPLKPEDCAEGLARVLTDADYANSLIRAGRETLVRSYVSAEQKWALQKQLLLALRQPSASVTNRSSQNDLAGVSSASAQLVPIQSIADSKRWRMSVPLETRAGYVQVAVKKWVRLAPVESVYFKREASLRMLFNYLRHIGLGATARKVVSRLGENLRNVRFVVTGFGHAESLSDGSQKLVFFLAPNHWTLTNYVCLPSELVWQVPLGSAPLDTSIDLEHGDALPTSLLSSFVTMVAGWERDSGNPIRINDECRAELQSVVAKTHATSVQVPRNLRLAKLPSVAHEDSPDRRVVTSLFGFGNYAKTVVLPYVSKNFRVTTIHELDPAQIDTSFSDVRWSTLPDFLPDEFPRAVIVAGYHHTHAGTALEAAKRGAKVLLEKPAGTTLEQLESLRRAINEDAAKMYAGYQRRYSRLTDFALEDLRLGLSEHEPIHYSCTVHEVPLPKLHWYRWPASRSRLVSNGCHWIDHFLYLNGYAEIAKIVVGINTATHHTCQLLLENGALFNMVLTDAGSSRLGVQDHVDLRCADRSATIINMSTYRCENSSSVLREARTNPMSAYRDMYRSISARMASADAPAESAKWVTAATHIAIQLEELAS